MIKEQTGRCKWLSWDRKNQYNWQQQVSYHFQWKLLEQWVSTLLHVFNFYEIMVRIYNCHFVTFRWWKEPFRFLQWFEKFHKEPKNITSQMNFNIYVKSLRFLSLPVFQHFSVFKLCKNSPVWYFSKKSKGPLENRRGLMEPEEFISD